ncbi:MAG: glycosyltransferase [bacterium]
MIAQNEVVARRFDRYGPIVEPHVVVETQAGGRHESRDGLRRAIFVGRLIPLKGLRLAIAGLAKAPSWRLQVVGDGPERRRCQRVARRYGVADRVNFRGQLSRSETLRAMEGADVLIHASFHEGAPWAVAEALSAGLRVVCLDSAGCASLADRSAVAVHAGPAMPRRISQALDEAFVAPGPSSRWGRGRLPELLSTWYGVSGPPITGAARGHQRRFLSRQESMPTKPSGMLT